MSLLKDLPIFRTVSDVVFDAVMDESREEEFLPGATLFSQGDEADAVYVIKRGSVRIVRSDGAVERDLAVLYNGEFFGEMGVMRKAPRSASAVAEVDVVVLVIPKASFQEFLASNPGVAQLVMSTMVARFKEEAFLDEVPARPVPAAEPAAAGGGEPAAPAPAEGGQAVAPEVGIPRPGNGVLVSVFSGTGGVGNTFVTANLAAAVARLTGSRVLVVDLDLMFGDQLAVLGSKGGGSVSDLLDGEPVDLERIQDCIQSTPAGVDLLSAPKEPEHADMVMPGFVIQCLELMRPRYDWIFCDTARLIQEISLSLLEMVQIPIYVLSPEVCAVKNATRWLAVMEKVGMPVERVQLLFNKVEEQDASTVAFLEEKFAKKALGRLPMATRQAKDSLNRGKVLCLQEERGPLGDAVEEVAAILAGIDVEKPSKRSFWSRWIRV